MPNGRILYCGKYNGFAGGIERYAYQTAIHLGNAGWSVDWYGEESGRGEDVFRKGFDDILTLSDALQQNYDLVILHKILEISILQQLRKRFGEKLVFLAHDHDLYCPRSYYYTPFGRTNCHRAFSPLRCGVCARLVSPRKWKGIRKNVSETLEELREHHAAVLSAFMQNNLQRNGFCPERIHRLPPVIDIPKEFRRNAKSDKLEILFLGQLIRGKGADLLLDALQNLSIPWHATIVGDGNDKTMLENMAKSLGLFDRITFTGWVNAPETYFASCDVTVFPSRWQEPFGLSGAEALAHGVPVVAFDIGGVREWLDDGVSGFVVPEKDVHAMAGKLEMLYNSPDLRDTMGVAGMEQMRSKFSKEHFIAAMQQIIQAVK